MSVSPLLEQPAKRKSLYYGWVIVVVGFLAHIASAFSISSTLSVFLKPLSADLGISRGMFSLIRSGEILIGAAAAPGGRHADGPLRRTLADGGRRFDFRRRLYLPRSSAGFHPVHARALAAHQSGRFAHGLHGGQCFDLALVRAHARPRPGDRRHGPWLGQSLHAGGGGDLDALRRLARRLGGLRRFRPAAGGRAGLAVYAPLPGRNGIVTGRRTGGAESGSRNAKKTHATPSAPAPTMSSGAGAKRCAHRSSGSSPAPSASPRSASPGSISMCFLMSPIKAIQPWWPRR